MKRRDRDRDRDRDRERQRGIEPYRHPEHPLLIVDVQSERNYPQCQSCNTHLQDIQTLQQKLIETHNKLLSQIDICTAQQITIVSLNKDKQKYKEDMARMYGDEHVDRIVEDKTALLRRDLEVMRTKVLAEISLANQLREQNKLLQEETSVKLQAQSQHMAELQRSQKHLLKQNREYEKKLQTLTQHLQALQHHPQYQSTDRDRDRERERDRGCLCGYQQKYGQLDQVFQKQALVAKELVEHNQALTNKIKLLEIRLDKGSFGDGDRRFDGRRNVKGYQEYEPAEGYEDRDDYLQLRTEPKKRVFSRDKGRNDFEDTKNLIRRMEQAQNTIRVRGKRTNL